jgi:CubicO group peptidase (beta-lactamase class C family)
MMLADEGKLSVDDPVEKYLPAFAGLMYTAKKDDAEIVLRKPARPVTIKDLLVHTSGLPFKSPVEEPTLDRLPLATAVRSYAMCPLEFQPGADFLYSNAGYNTAGLLIELLSGQPYEQFLNERLFGPLGMHDTTFWPDAEQAGHLAASYTADPSGRQVKIPIEQLLYPLTDGSHRHPMPAGGLFSTARDLAIFYRMLLNGGSLDGRTYLAPDTVREMTRRHTPDSWEKAQGLGFVADGRSFGHGGAYGTSTRVNLASGLILGWLVQQAVFHGEGAKALESFEKAALAKFARA